MLDRSREHQSNVALGLADISLDLHFVLRLGQPLCLIKFDLTANEKAFGNRISNEKEKCERHEHLNTSI